MTSQPANDSEPNGTIPGDARPRRPRLQGGRAGRLWRSSRSPALRPGQGTHLEWEDPATDAVEQTTDAASEATDSRQWAADEMMGPAAGPFLSVARPTGRASGVTVRLSLNAL